MNVTGYYYIENGEKHQIDEKMAEQVRKQIVLSQPVDTGGKTLYPILADVPEDKAFVARMEAWCVDHMGHPRTLWYWRIREHKPQHHGCKVIDDGLCVFKMVEYMTWNRESHKWELEPIVNKATPEQEKVLDNN